MKTLTKSTGSATFPKAAAERPYEESLEEAIATHPFWIGLSRQYVPLLAGCAHFEYFDPQQQIFQTDSDAEYFYLIRSGHVALETGFLPGRGVVRIQMLAAGEALGWSWFYPPYTWHFGARAMDYCEVIALDGKALREAAERDHNFGYELAMRMGAVMLERLQSTRRQLISDREPAS